MSRARMKLETSNLACRLATWEPKQKMQIRSNLVVKGSYDLLLIFWKPSIFVERLKLETSNLPHKLATGASKRNNAKLGKQGL